MQQNELDVGTHEFGEPPETVQENIRDMSAVMAQRRAANLRTAIERDTERYLVVVYRDRAGREAALRELGLPEDERYVLGDIVRLHIDDGKRWQDALVMTERECKVADIGSSGEAG